MFIPNFEAIGHVTSVLGLGNRPESLAKSGLIQKRLKYDISQGYMQYLNCKILHGGTLFQR